MDAYENMIRLMKQYPKNHYKFLGLQKKVNEHISGLRLEATKMPFTSFGKICGKEANRYERLLNSVLRDK